jgi:hypothetical protein
VFYISDAHTTPCKVKGKARYSKKKYTRKKLIPPFAFLHFFKEEAFFFMSNPITAANKHSIPFALGKRPYQ